MRQNRIFEIGAVWRGGWVGGLGVKGGSGVAGGWERGCEKTYVYSASEFCGGAYLRPVRGCIRAGCEVAAAAAGCLGLLTFVLLFANSKRMVCGISGSNLTPCCK